MRCNIVVVQHSSRVLLAASSQAIELAPGHGLKQSINSWLAGTELDAASIATLPNQYRSILSWHQAAAAASWLYCPSLTSIMYSESTLGLSWLLLPAAPPNFLICL